MSQIAKAYLYARLWVHNPKPELSVVKPDGPYNFQLIERENRPELAMSVLCAIGLVGWRVRGVPEHLHAIWFERELEAKEQAQKTIEELGNALQAAGLLMAIVV